MGNSNPIASKNYIEIHGNAGINPFVTPKRDTSPY